MKNIYNFNHILVDRKRIVNNNPEYYRTLTLYKTSFNIFTLKSPIRDQLIIAKAKGYINRKDYNKMKNIIQRYLLDYIKWKYNFYEIQIGVEHYAKQK